MQVDDGELVSGGDLPANGTGFLCGLLVFWKLKIRVFPIAGIFSNEYASSKGQTRGNPNSRFGRWKEIVFRNTGGFRGASLGRNGLAERKREFT